MNHSAWFAIIYYGKPRRYNCWRRLGRGGGTGVSCCAGDELPTGMIWLRHELQLALHELRCGALGSGIVGDAGDILTGASPFISATECIG